MKFERRDYQDNESLDTLAHKIASVVPELEAAREASFKAFYSTAEPEHIGGKCRRLDGAVRYQTGRDFFVLVHKDPFIQGDTLQRFRLLTHELYHIAREKTYFVSRHHAADFCEIPDHDKWSYRLAIEALRLLHVQYDNEASIRHYAGVDLKNSGASRPSV